MAQSVKIDFKQWSQFDLHAYQIINQDFVHDTLLTVNANILSNKSKVRLQQSLKHANQKFNTGGQFNVWFPLVNDKSLYFQSRTKGFRIHFDNGLISRGHLKHNIYASYQTSRKLNQSLFKLGCQTIAQKWRSNLRYRYSTDDQDHALYSRWRYDYENFTFEGIKAWNLKESILLKSGLLAGYYQGNKTFHVRLQHDGWRTEPFNSKNIKLNSFFDHLTFNFTKTISQNHRVGVQTGVSITGNLRPSSIVWESHDANLHNTLKLKINSNRSAALSLRNKMGNYGSYVFGVGLSGLGTQNKVNFGVLVDLNV